TLGDNIELNDVGYLMALTGNSEINKYAINKFQKQFGENGSFRLVDSDEMNDPANNPEEGLFSHTDDFIKLTEAARKFPAIHEQNIKDQEHYERLIEATNTDDEIIPLFLKEPEGELTIMAANSKKFKDITNGSKLVYLGKMLAAEA
ncbi:MAG: cell shape-determining protein, partial [Eudoraea sp.]|nr:cell shape-determining protein [Eudoraea sp.]